MNHFRKIRDIRKASKRLVENSDLLVALFKDIPELQNFKFSVSQEYDDNNYFDSVRLVEINGHAYDFDGYDDDSEESELPRVEQTDLIKNALGLIADNYDNSAGEVEIKREDYEAGKEPLFPEERIYLGSYLSGSEIPVSFFVDNNPKWAVYYAMDHGRFPEDDEFDIFARNGWMDEALCYAEVVGRLVPELENFYILNASEEDSECLKKYLEKFVRVEQCV
jgi:hypothetical protein